MREAVRRAGPEDAERFLELAWAFYTGLLRHRGGDLLVTPIEGMFDFDRFRAVIDDPDRLVLMGTIDDVPVGTAMAHVEPMRDGRLLARFDGCYVEDDGRGVGLGHLLADAVAGWARDRGCVGIDGECLPGDRAAKSFFEAGGYKARLLTMHRAFT